ncbi:MAG: hypothetical protein M4579_001304 [Chaenotheca gracillima]|nr:MAG: hypothetical protein M4579_001304 [Chaenotheca gracillima]
MAIAMASTSRCEELASPGWFGFTLSVMILFGILFSYLPQHYRIVHRRSSEGISPYFVLLGTTSGTCAFANILVLPSSRQDVMCCKEINGYGCIAGLLGIAQVGVQWACFAVILLLFLLFFPRATPLVPPQPHTVRPTYKVALVVTGLCILHFIITFGVSLGLLLTHPKAASTLANVLGILAAILSSIQYFPQLWTTFKLKAVGSLSIPMMCIQTPGSFLWAGSLAARLGAEGWSAWGVYLVTGTLQGTLLTMGIYFELLDRKEKRVGRGVGDDFAHSTNHETDDEGGNVVEGDGSEDDTAATERTPLVRGSSRK